MSVLRWLMEKLKSIERRIGKWIFVVIGFLVFCLLLNVVIYGVTLLWPVILAVAGLITVVVVVSDDSASTSSASSNLLAVAIAFVIYIEFFDTLLKYSKGDVGLAWLSLILISALIAWIIKFGVMLIYNFYISRR